MHRQVAEAVGSRREGATGAAGQPEQRPRRQVDRPEFGGQLPRSGQDVDEHVEVGAGVGVDGALGRERDDVRVQVALGDLELEEMTRTTERNDPDLAHLLDGTEGNVHPPVRRTGTRLRWWVVAAVMLSAVLYAIVILLLPDPLEIAVVVVVQLLVVPVGCLLWARRHGEL